jgi:hypothetical protein
MSDVGLEWMELGVTHRHRHAERSCPSSRDGAHDRLGMRDQPWMNGCWRTNVSECARWV